MSLSRNASGDASMLILFPGCPQGAQHTLRQCPDAERGPNERGLQQWARAANETGPSNRAPSSRGLPSRAEAGAHRRRHRLLPHAAVLVTHLVRAHPACWTTSRSATTTAPGPKGQRGSVPPSSVEPGSHWFRGHLPHRTRRLTRGAGGERGGLRRAPNADRPAALKFSNHLLALPERYTVHAELLERVDECQSPLLLAVEVGLGTSARTGRCRCSSKPQQRPRRPAGSPQSSTRGSTGSTRRRGSPSRTTPPPGSALARRFHRFGRPVMVGMLARIKRQVAAKSAAEPGPKEPAVCRAPRAHRGMMK